MDKKYIDFDSRMPSIYWSDVTRASYLQRRVIVHSILYYQMDTNVISDKQFDRLSKQLVELRDQMDEEDYRKTEYYYCFEDFDGSTGFDLPDRLNQSDKRYLRFIAQQVQTMYRQEQNG